MMPPRGALIPMTVLLMGTIVSTFSAVAHARVMPPLTTNRRETGLLGTSEAGAPAIMGAALATNAPALPKVGIDSELMGKVAQAMRTAAPKRRRLATSQKEAWMGAWKQESIDGDGLDASLKAEGTPYLIRKLVKSIKRKLEIEVDGQGFVVIKTPVPTAGTVEFRVQETKELADRSPVTFSIMGIDMAVSTHWEGKAVVQTTVKSTKGTSDTITARVVYQLDESAAGHPRLRAREESESGAYSWVLGHA